MTVDLQCCYKKSEKIVTRQIEDQLIIIPLVSGIGSLDSDIFTLNQTATMVWKRLNGRTPLSDIIHDISRDFKTSHDSIKSDVIDLMDELIKKKIVTP